MAQNIFSTRKSALTDFEILHSFFNGEDKFSSLQTSKALDGIRSAYGLEGKELQLVTYLLSTLPELLSLQKVPEVLGLQKGDNGAQIVNYLIRRNFIRICTSSSVYKFIALTTEAKTAFNKYESFGILPERDFIELFFKTSSAQICTTSWIKDFRQELDVHRHSVFVQKLVELGAFKIPDSEMIALCVALSSFVTQFSKPFTPGSIEKDLKIRVDFDPMVKRGLLVKRNEGYVIAPKVAEALFKGRDDIVNYDEISSRVRVIKSCDIEKKELFFSPESLEEIDHLHYMLSKEGFEHARSVLVRKKRNPAIQSLLWGGPGTGKTETVKQIARETGRDIFLFDAAKVTASEWGATENLYRSLFDSYRYVVAVKSLAPILLINEADQVLSRRLTELERSIDKGENVVSDILLQEFEDMHGILLATTNNAKILDEAFDRRFLFKTELQKPDAGARKSIWKSMIPELTEEEAEILANKYEMSGAQINNVATKRDLAELYFLGDRGLPYIEKLCTKELGVEKLNPTNRRIGF